MAIPVIIRAAEKFNNTTNSYAQFTFTGVAVKWISPTNGNLGKADIYLDGVLSAVGIDCYASNGKNYQQVLYSKTGLSNTSHTIKVVVTGTKNPGASDVYLVIDAFEYTRGTGATATPTPTSTPTPTPTPTGTPVPGNSVSYLATDTSTQGTWKSVYGVDGYDIRGSSASLPSYATIAYPDGADYTWASSTTDVRALQKPNPATDRIAACRFSGTTETIDLTVSGGVPKNIEIYLLDWDNRSRAMTVDAMDGDSGTILNTQSVSAFTNGKYLKYTVKGHIKFRFTKTAGDNGVFSGVFFN